MYYIKSCFFREYTLSGQAFLKGGKPFMLNVAYLKQNKLINLTTKALRLIPHLEMMTDIDGRIYSSVEDIKKENLITPRLIPAALKECEKFGFITKNADGSYKNNFHYLTTGEEKQFKYINVYDFFNHDAFKKHYKRSLNFFYYILTSKLPGKFHTIAAERLYKNSLNEDNLVIDYFQDFNDMVTHVSKWVSEGYLEVKIDGQLFSNVSGSDKETYFNIVKDALYTYCGKTSLNNRKSRIRNEKDHHLLKLRVSEKMVSKEKIVSVYDRRSTLKDLEEIALQYGFDLNDFHIEYLHTIHQLKKKMHDELGSVGIRIYRQAIINFFENGSYNFDDLILNNTFSIVLYKGYILPIIKMEIHSYFNTISPEAIETNSFVEKLLGLFTMNAYRDDLVLFENELQKQDSYVYEGLCEESTTWLEFKKAVFNIYKDEHKVGNPKYKVLQLAMEQKLSSRQRFEEDAKEYFKDKESVAQRNRYVAPFYNWLES